MVTSFGFSFWLLAFVIITGIISLVDLLFFRRKRAKKQPIIVEYARALFVVLLVVWFVRSFVIQPYRVPTSSLAPTVLPGDFLAVSEYDYGERFPVTHALLFHTTVPKRGDIALFRWPVNPNITYVKRVMGVPGDHIVYKNKILSINGHECKQVLKDRGAYSDQFKEVCKGFAHDIQIDAVSMVSRGHDDFSLIVPQGQYFLMGDNRDHSNDSRVWGFVPYKNLIGKALFIWLSWNPKTHEVRWHRMGRGV
jgi:signal peptidase I